MEPGTRHACGLFGVWGHPDAVAMTSLGLHALQHRGQEAAGIVSTNGEAFKVHRGEGLVADALSPDTLERLKNPVAIGHVRYSTTGSSTLQNAQPMVFDYSRGKIAIAHNGNLVNARTIRDEFEAYGSIFQTSSDTEIIVHLMARPTATGPDGDLYAALAQIRGAYTLLLLRPDEMIGLRDPQGFRPLVLGERDGAWILASETCALNQVGARFIREVEPGEIVFITKNGVRSDRLPTAPGLFPGAPPAHCIFEHIYFARPDSRIFGDSVIGVRRNLGRKLAMEHPVKADIVVPVPDSGLWAALGFSAESGIPLDFGFIRNHYVGRTFIAPEQRLRTKGVEMKLSVVPEVVRGKRVVIVDDSVIRGTTSKSRVRILREAGAAEVHFRVSCPTTRHPCFYGIDFPNPSELVGHERTLEEIRTHIGVDSIGYLSLEGMLSCVSNPPDHYCTACFTGRYPIPVEERLTKLGLENGA